LLKVTRVVVCFCVTLGSARADCIEEVLLEGMRLCLNSDQGSAESTRRLVDILNGRDLLGTEQQSNLRDAFSECVRRDARQTANFSECQAFDPRIPLNMGRSLLGQPAVR
jgi:hypothetical protein